jgi:hypothetical protein
MRPRKVPVNPSPTAARRVSDQEWEALLAEKKVPTDGRRVPSNILKRPIQLPPMERVQK